MQAPRPSPPEPVLVTRWFMRLRHALIGFFTAPIAAWALGYATFGAASPLTTFLGFASAAAFIVTVFMLAHRRETIVRRLREIDFAACTRCAYPLDRAWQQCPECGLQITPAQAAEAWKASRWAR